MWKSAAQKSSGAANIFDAIGQSDSKQVQAKATVEDDDIDPLDAYMAALEKEVEESASKNARVEGEIMEAEDAVASYYDEVDTRKQKLAEGDSDSENQCDASDSEVDRRRKPIEPLKTIDHSLISYDAFCKDFYVEHEEITKLTDEQLVDLKSSLSISATGSDIPRPVCSFVHFGFKRDVMDILRKMEFTRPTPIQAQAIPCALKGRDIIGIAETGSGKTLAYVLPMLVHIMNQRDIEKGEGPIAMIICPTRELSVQIEKEVFRFAKKMGITTVTLVGGLSKHEQFKICKAGCEVLIGTPGRIIDVHKLKGLTFTRVTYVVLDEADRMFDMGFEYQMNSIVHNTRPDRQTMLFSATFPPKIERLARESLTNPVRITIGKLGQATANVEQQVVVLKDDEKWSWISQNIRSLTADGQIMIFVHSRKAAEDLKLNLETVGIRPSILHGDLDQNDRMAMMRQFRKRETSVLVATDIAARGLDIPCIRFVISYDAATTIETHTHRIGRTGRAGETGIAITLLTKKEKKLAALLVEQLELQQKVPDDLLQLALSYPPFQAARKTGSVMSSKGKGKNSGKVGLGFEDTPVMTKRKLEKNIQKNADLQFKRNKLAQQGGQKDPSNVLLGFVAAKLDNACAKMESTEMSSDSDDDLFAPGVATRLGKGGGVPFAQAQGFVQQPHGFSSQGAPHTPGFAAQTPAQGVQAPVQSQEPDSARTRRRRSKWEE